MDDPNFGVTVHDPTTGQDVVLSEKDVATIKRLRGGKVPNGEYNLHEDWVDFYRCAHSVFLNLIWYSGGSLREGHGGPRSSHFSEQQEQVRFQQADNQGLRQLFLTVSLELRG